MLKKLVVMKMMKTTEVIVSMKQLKKSLTFLQMVYMNLTLKPTQIQSKMRTLTFQATGAFYLLSPLVYIKLF